MDLTLIYLSKATNIAWMNIAGKNQRYKLLQANFNIAAM